MIAGLGVDMVDIRRIEKLIHTHGAHFLDRTFTPAEQAYCNSKAQVGAAYAKTFAAKEAIIKALSHTDGLKWHHMEIIRLPHGQPTIKLQGQAHDLALSRTHGQPYAIHLSLSDEPPYAVAYVILETIGKS